MAASSIEDLRNKLKGLSDMLGGTGIESRVGVAVSVSPPRAKPRPATAAAAPAARHLPPPPRTFQPTVRPGSSVLQAANVHARDAPIGGLLAKYKDAEAGWLKVRRPGRVLGMGRRKGRQVFCLQTEPRRLTLACTPPTTLPQEKGRLQMAVKAEQQRRAKAEGELRRVQVRADRCTRKHLIQLQGSAWQAAR